MTVTRRCPDLHTAACCVEVFAIQTLQRGFSFANLISAPGEVLVKEAGFNPQPLWSPYFPRQDPVLLQKEAGTCLLQVVNTARLAGCDFDNKLGVNDDQQNDKLISCSIIPVLHLGLACPLLCLMTAGNCLIFAANVCFPCQPLFCRGQWCCSARCS